MPLAESPDPTPPGPTRTLDRILLVATTACLFTLATHELFAYDIWWQIASGQWIWTHGWPSVDPFSYGFPGREWVEPRWVRMF